MRRCLVLAALMFLAACASVPLPSGSRSQLRDFSLEGRFALRVDRPNDAPASASGRLHWQHAGKEDRLLIAGPLGGGIATLDLAERARLTLANGDVRESSDGEALLREATGLALPVTRLTPWLLGRAHGGQLSLDDYGRPLSLREDGWLIDYFYGDDAPDALPVRLTLRRDGVLELRLRIEVWSDLP